MHPLLKKTWTTIAILAISDAAGYGQPGVDKKIVREKFHDAEYFFLRGDFREAAFLYQELLNADPANANLQFLTGASYLSVDGMKERALPFLERAVNSVTAGYREGYYREHNAPSQAFFALGRAYHIGNRFDDALVYYKKYKNVMPLYDAAGIDYVNAQLASVELARTMIRDTVRFSMRDAGDRVNDSPFTSRAVLAGRDSVLVYMSQRPFYQAIMMTRAENGIWSTPGRYQRSAPGGRGM